MSDEATVVVDVRSALWGRAVADPGAVCRGAAGAALSVAGDRLSAAGAGRGEISIVLAEDRFIRELNRAHRGKDSATNVLAFPLGHGSAEDDGEDGPRLLGDIVVAFETTEREASAFGRSLSDRLAHLVVHATLHLIGYRHDEPAEAEVMERLEVEALAMLGVADPYAIPAAVGA